MYLLHDTEFESVMDILKDGCLKSLSMILKYNKKKKANQGYDIYTKNDYIYFACVDTLFHKDIMGNVILYFDSKILYNRVFYVNNSHASSPNITGKKYDRYYNKYDDVLKNTYKKIISGDLGSKYFQVEQQIAIKNKISLNNLVAIEFLSRKGKNIPSDKLLNYITKYYPNVLIKTTLLSDNHYKNLLEN